MHSLEDTEMQGQIQQKIEINDLMMECITILRKSEDHEAAFNKLLGLVASFYGADRSYIFEFDLGSQRLSNTYEWCAEGIEAEINKLQNLDLSIVDRWIVQFEAHGEFYINSTAGELDHDSDEYKILAMQGIQSLMAAPLHLGGDIVGFLGVDNPRTNTNTLLVLQAVSSFVVNQLGKQREERQGMMLSALAANAFDEDVQRSLQEGMNAHLSKPVEPDHLYQTLGELIYEAEKAD